MNIVVNGRPRAVEDCTSVARLLESLGMRAEHVAVEQSGVVLEPSDIATAMLREGDQLEIVHFVGGG
jgi:thiamine biosynthesis protein ThiS